MAKETIINFDNLLLITKENFDKAKKVLDKGININPDGMDYMDIYALLCLIGATGNSDNYAFTKEIDPKNARDLESELPCEYTFGPDIEFILV